MNWFKCEKNFTQDFLNYGTFQTTQKNCYKPCVWRRNGNEQADTHWQEDIKDNDHGVKDHLER